MIAPDPQIWPVSVAGWVAFITSSLSLIAIIFASGKFYGKLEELIKINNEQKDVLDQIEEDYTLLKHIVMGPLGNNGLVSKVTQLNKRVDLIQERNTRIDAIKEREKGAQEAGIESRQHSRRAEDKILKGEDRDDASDS